eukprot:TRINITY_DN31519_c0_g1_i1.p1 TRINITY_DN31519_c0_g1~~TRINITY_DN31519_c0_g1_i1.p1  ORF type:complete len:407 (-),score=70.09 TRINITY_DN31519_c0_g1_i1:383-1603(-)
MWKPLLILVLFCLVVWGRIQNNPSEYDPAYPKNAQVAELVQFISLFRHGDRTPIHQYSFEQATYPWEAGKLTVRGMLTAFNIGQDYQNIMESAISPDDVQVYSTDFDRTVDTANSVLLGLFLKHGPAVSENLGAALQCRPEGGLRSPPSCLAQCLNIKEAIPQLPPVEISLEEIIAIQQKDKCQGFWTWDSMLEKTPGYQYAQNVTYVTAINTIRKLAGSAPELCTISGRCQDFGLKAVEEVWSNLQCARSAGKQYTKQYQNDELFQILNPTTKFLWHSTYALSQGTQTGGILLKQIVDILSSNKAVESEKQFKPVVLFSGHDTSVFGLLGAMGMTNDAHLPEFGAHISFALYKNTYNEQLHLEIRYDGEQFGILGCETGVCPLDNFLKEMKDRTMSASDCEVVAT